MRLSTFVPFAIRTDSASLEKYSNSPLWHSADCWFSELPSALQTITEPLPYPGKKAYFHSIAEERSWTPRQVQCPMSSGGGRAIEVILIMGTSSLPKAPRKPTRIVAGRDHSGCLTLALSGRLLAFLLHFLQKPCRDCMLRLWQKVLRSESHWIPPELEPGMSPRAS